MQTRWLKKRCPYCGEMLDLMVDDSIPDQHYIEDCQVCCKPIEVVASTDLYGDFQLRLYRDDE